MKNCEKCGVPLGRWDTFCRACDEGPAVPAAPLVIITHCLCSTNWVLCGDTQASVAPCRWRPLFGPLPDLALRVTQAEAETLIRILNLHGCKIEQWSEAVPGTGTLRQPTEAA